MDPSEPTMRVRTFRVPDDLYLAAGVAAERRGETVSDAIRRFLEEYAQDED
jgi:antitoxin component of RelBE/YafQ-DinJ toxin-antitoxin module